MTEMTPDDVFKLVKDEDVRYVDVRFCDLPGVMQHFTIPATGFDESLFENGIAFDGSSIRGFQSIHESDMLLLPDPDTAQIDGIAALRPMHEKPRRRIRCHHRRVTAVPQHPPIDLILQHEIKRIIDVRPLTIVAHSRGNPCRRAEQRKSLVHKMRSEINQQPRGRRCRLLPRIHALQRAVAVKTRHDLDHTPQRALIQ